MNSKEALENAHNRAEEFRLHTCGKTLLVKAAVELANSLIAEAFRHGSTELGEGKVLYQGSTYEYFYDSVFDVMRIRHRGNHKESAVKEDPADAVSSDELFAFIFDGEKFIHAVTSKPRPDPTLWDR